MTFNNQVQQFSHPIFILLSFLISTFISIFKKAASIDEHFYKVLVMNSIFVFIFGILHYTIDKDLSITKTCLIASLLLNALGQAFKYNLLGKPRGVLRVFIISVLIVLTAWSFLASIFGLVIYSITSISSVRSLFAGELSVLILLSPLITIICFYSIVTAVRLIRLFFSTSYL